MSLFIFEWSKVPGNARRLGRLSRIYERKKTWDMIT